MDLRAWASHGPQAIDVVLDLHPGVAAVLMQNPACGVLAPNCHEDAFARVQLQSACLRPPIKRLKTRSNWAASLVNASPMSSAKAHDLELANVITIRCRRVGGSGDPV